MKLTGMKRIFRDKIKKCFCVFFNIPEYPLHPCKYFFKRLTFVRVFETQTRFRRKIRIMKKNILAVVLSLLFFQTVMAQTGSIKEANPADVSSIDAIMKSVYDVISGEVGKKRDWERFRSLFHPDARMIPAGKNKEGAFGARSFTPDEYIARSSPFMEKEGFFERELARRTDVYGNIAQVFSTYQSFHKADDKKPFARGINSFQLLNDGKRWWVLTIYWQNETPDAPIPKEYLKSRKS